jgi:hypothetical protein
MENPIEGIDWELLKSQKSRLVNLIYTNNQTSQEDADALEGILMLLDNIQDYAVSEMGVDENIVFDLNKNEK